MGVLNDQVIQVGVWPTNGLISLDHFGEFTIANAYSRYGDRIEGHKIGTALPSCLFQGLAFVCCQRVDHFRAQCWKRVILCQPYSTVIANQAYQRHIW